MESFDKTIYESEIEATREFTVREKIELLSHDERARLLQDALKEYNELEELIHTITGLDPEVNQEYLF